MGVAVVTSLAVIGVAASAVTRGVPKLPEGTHVGGWRQLGRRVEAAEADLEELMGQEPFVLGADEYYIAAEINFYTREPDE